MASFSKASLVILTIFSYHFLSLAQNVFSNPPAWTQGFDFSQNDVFVIGSLQLLEWATNHTSYNVLLWQQSLTTDGEPNAGPSVFGKSPSDPEPGSAKWQVQSYQFDLAVSNVFYFSLTPTDDLYFGFESHHFNLTTVSATGSVPTISPTASCTFLPSPSEPTVKVSSTPLASSSHDLATGLGVGLPLACLLGMAIGSYITMRRMRAKDSQVEQGSEEDSAKGPDITRPGLSDQAIPKLPRGPLDGSIHEAPGSVHTAEVITRRREETVAVRFLPAIPRVASGMRQVLAYEEEPARSNVDWL